MLNDLFWGYGGDVNVTEINVDINLGTQKDPVRDKKEEREPRQEEVPAKTMRREQRELPV